MFLPCVSRALSRHGGLPLHLNTMLLVIAILCYLIAAGWLARPMFGHQTSNAPASYWLSLRDYDPIATAKGLSEPMLVLQGGADYQVTPQHDFVGWQAAFAHSPRAKLIEYPGLSHLFMLAGNPPSPADYAKPSHVDAQVVHDIAAWIKAQPAHS